MLEYGSRGRPPTLLLRATPRIVEKGDKKTTHAAAGASVRQTSTQNGRSSDVDDIEAMVHECHRTHVATSHEAAENQGRNSY